MVKGRIASIQEYWFVIVSDLVIVMGIFLIPTLAHLSPFPIYYLDPMRILLLIGYALTKSKNNSIILAIGIPLTSTFLSGHPLGYKAILISVELLLNMTLYFKFIKVFQRYRALSLFTSIIASKLIYYMLKFIFLRYSLIYGPLVSTSIVVQLISVTAISVVYHIMIHKSHYQR
jgi:hypothetical protein